MRFDRIALSPAVMSGKPCIRGMRVTVGRIVDQLAAGKTDEELLTEFPLLEADDIEQALRYAIWIASTGESPRRTDAAMEKLLMIVREMVDPAAAGGETFDAEAWLGDWVLARVPALRARPVDLLRTEEGVAEVVRVLRAMRYGVYL